MPDRPDLGIWLTPFGDLLNHQNPPHLLWKYREDNEGRKGWIAHAREDIPAGVQVYTSYGTTPSQFKYPIYGFLPEVEDEDFDVFLEIKIKKDELKDLKINILGDRIIDLQLSKTLTPEQLSKLRIVAYPDV